MKGSIVRRGHNRYAIIIEQKDASTGQRVRKWHTFHGDRKAADAERSRLLVAVDGGTYIEPTKTTLSQYLDTWLQHVAGSVATRTHERYSEIVRLYLKPALGAVVLAKLSAETVGAGYDRIKAKRTKGAGELSARTMLHVHRVLFAALRQAVRWGKLHNNPAAEAKRFKVERKPVTTYTMPEAFDALEALRGSWIYVPALLGIMCGLRRGEIAALRWGAVDLDSRQLAVVQSAEKTKAGVRYKETKSGRVRTVALPASVVTELRAHRLRQAEQLLRLGARPEGQAFVVAQADGAGYDPDSISKEWRLAVIRHGLRRIRFHDSRHTHATHMLASGVHIKVASERLGHSRVGITLDTYSHVVEGMQEEAVDLVEQAMAAALAKRG
jgi:integrase